MKKSYLVKHILRAVDRYLVYGWEREHLSMVECEARVMGKVTQLTGDIYYFHFYDCEGLYPDFIIKFGERLGGEEITDIDFLSVVKGKDGKAKFYEYRFCTQVKGLSIAEITVDVIQSINFMIKD